MIIPENYQRFKMVTQDPGLNNIGLAVFNVVFDDRTPYIESIYAETLTTKNVKEITGYDVDLTEEQFVKKKNMVASVAKFVQDENPCIFVTETAFFDRLHPTSYAILSTIISEVFDEVLQHDPNIVLGKLAPKAVKKVFGIAGQKGKDPVKDAVVCVKEITDVLTVDIETLSEHAIDAIAIGYAYLVDTLCLKLKEKPLEKT